MENSVIALFGGAQKGDLETIYYCKTIEELFQYFGEPPAESEGLFYAIQALLMRNPLIYFRVREEGSSFKDYHFGLHLLRELTPSIPHVGALFLPRVGSKAIIDEGLALCEACRSLLLMKGADFYDYLTDKSHVEPQHAEEMEL